jgi:hypothetical protein
VTKVARKPCSLDANDMRRLCGMVNHFSRKADWRWKGLPVIVWEFAMIGDYANALDDIRAAFPIESLVQGPAHRTVASGIEEVDCNGVTFRLVCRALTG